MTTLFSDGFESGDFSAWTGTQVDSGFTLQVTTSNPHHGTYNLEATCPAGGLNARKAVAYWSPGTNYVLFARAENCRYSQNPGTDTGVPFLQMLSTQRVMSAGVFNVGGSVRWGIRYRHNGAYYNALGSSTPQPNTNYTLEFEMRRSTTGNADGAARLYVNGSLEIEVTGIDNDDVDWGNFNFGICSLWNNQPNAITFTGDCVVVADIYIGPEAGGQLYEISVDAVCQSLATPAEQCMFNIAKDAAVASQVSPLNFQLDIPKDAVTEVLTLHSEEATYNLIKDAITQALATALFETGIFKNAIAQAMATPNIEIVFTIPKDAIVRTLTDSAIQSIFNLSPEAVVKVLAEASVMKEGEVKIIKLFLILGNLAIQIQG